MNTCYVVRSSRPAGLFSFGLLDGLQVRLRRPYLRDASAGFGLERLATAFMIGNRRSRIYHRPDCPNYSQIAPHNRVEFDSAAEVEAAGYRRA